MEPKLDESYVEDALRRSAQQSGQQDVCHELVQSCTDAPGASN